MFRWVILAVVVVAVAVAVGRSGVIGRIKDYWDSRPTTTKATPSTKTPEATTEVPKPSETKTSKATTTTAIPAIPSTLELMLDLPDYGKEGRLVITLVDYGDINSPDYGGFWNSRKEEIIEETTVMLNGGEYKTYIQGLGHRVIDAQIYDSAEDSIYWYIVTADFTAIPPKISSLIAGTRERAQ